MSNISPWGKVLLIISPLYQRIIFAHLVEIAAMSFLKVYDAV
jgi:hypothetical protein